MTNGKDFEERRVQDRYSVLDGAFAAVKGDFYVVGPIQNISLSGFAFRYIGRGGKIQGLLEVDIFFCGEGLFLQKVKSRAVEDFKIDRKVADSSITIRQCCAQFLELSDAQASKLDLFIRKFVDRRSGQDRRKLPPPLYSGPERRKGAERRKFMPKSTI